MTQIPGSVYRPTIGILTALPKEHAAVRTLMDHPVSHTETDHQGTRHYTLGTMPANNGEVHALALTMVGVGNSISAAATTQLLNDLPSVRTVILSGIAGGVPNVLKAEDHVRLGDIVVSNENGIIQYDFVKEEMGKIIPRHPPRPASSNLVRAARVLEADAILGSRPWEAFIAQALVALGWRRPPQSSDLLASTEDQSRFLKHPTDPSRIKKQPRVFLGPIASSNVLLKNPVRRDELRDRYGVKAVEMEGSGTADAAWMSQAHHFVIRGICDYCDPRKGDAWQNYAAAAAAGYLKAILRIVGEFDKKKVIITSNVVRSEAARTPLGRIETLSLDDETLQQIDDTQVRLRMLLVDRRGEAAFLIPMLSWMTSIDRKFHQSRLLVREAEAVAAINAEMRRANSGHLSNAISPIKRLSLNLLESYQDNHVLRANWEVRCAIGNLLTLAVSEGRNSTSQLITQVMQASESRQNWDLAQMLFDALHHAKNLTRSGRDFLLTIAIEHEHRQVRWNVAAALKSVRVSERDLAQILTRLLHDRSSWVIKELMDVGLKNERILGKLSSPKNAPIVLELLEQNEQLREHMVLSVSSRSQLITAPLLVRLLSEPARYDQLSLGHDRRMLGEDFRRVEKLKVRLGAQHGRLYKAAERVVFQRIASSDPEQQQCAITTYLHSSHDALAWASVRALFSGKLDRWRDDFLRQAVSDMLTHPSEWIRRECVEETLRLQDGRRKYLALREIEVHRHELWQVDEIRPYLLQIGMQLEGT
jgi:nucleoside phosphorylase